MWPRLWRLVAPQLGVAGSDVIHEFDYPDLYAPLDLGIGRCRLSVAELASVAKDDTPARWSHIRIATKYPNLTRKHFEARGVQAEWHQAQWCDGACAEARLVRAHRGSRLLRCNAESQRTRGNRENHGSFLSFDRQPCGDENPWRAAGSTRAGV